MVFGTETIFARYTAILTLDIALKCLYQILKTKTICSVWYIGYRPIFYGI